MRADPASSRAASGAPALRRRGALVLVCGAILIFALTLGGAAFRIPGLALSPWWPASGAAACMVVRTAPRRRAAALALIFAATALGSLLVVGPTVETFLFAGLNTLEAGLFVWLFEGVRAETRAARPAPPRLRTTADALRFLMAAAVATVGVALALGVMTALSGTADPLVRGAMTAASHFSAIVLITPLALLPDHTRRHARRVDLRPELIAQIAITAAVVAAFFSPFFALPLSFLLFLPLIWAALRFSPIVAHLEAVTTATAVVVATDLGWGAFARSSTAGPSLAISVVVFLSALGVVTVLTTTERTEARGHASAAVDAADARAEAARATAATLQMRYDLDRQRQDFLSTTSHELRTPVTIISGYSEILAERDLPADATAWAEAIGRNAGRLSRMLDDLLAFSSAQAEPPAPTTFTAAQLVDIAVTEQTAPAWRRDLTMTMLVPAHLTVHADHADAVRALGCLISNALKFSPDGERVRIDAREVGADIMISVTDNGPGLPPAELDQAFEPFYRGADAEALALPGTGLGLAIARMLARRNGGDVTLVSPATRGARATLVLPAGHATLSAAASQGVEPS